MTGIVFQFVAYRAEQRIRLAHQRARRAVQASRPHAQVRLVGFNAVLEIEEVVTRGCLSVFHQAVNAVLNDQLAIQHRTGIDRRRRPQTAQSGAGHAGTGR